MFFTSRLSFCAIRFDHILPKSSTGLNVLCKKLSSTVAESSSPKCHVPVQDKIQQQLLMREPDQPPNPARLRVGVIGMPNVGKSTLINNLTGMPVLPTARKPDSTTSNALAILTLDNTQIEFYDSPGIRTRSKSKKIIGNYEHANMPGQCLQEAHLCMVVVDLVTASIRRGTLSAVTILHLLKYQHVPSILVLNKVDKMHKQHEVLSLISALTNGTVGGMPFGPKETAPMEPIEMPPLETEVTETFKNVKKIETSEINTALKQERQILNDLSHCTGWPHFQEVFVVSALLGENVNELRNYLLSKAVAESWRFHSKTVTDQSTYNIAKDAVRATLMENLNEELPYTTKAEVMEWQSTENSLNIFIELQCVKAKHISIVENRAKTIAFGIRRRLSQVFGVNVEITLTVNLA
uniref:GTPase Era, mitochondrial n=1 Tax=Phallusia mammillata TaxID=59560 RepID=A0A6F9DC13_9ASCI|nr:GTPase Era, mitochondrial-like [Phallusia mammillata]